MNLKHENSWRCREAVDRQGNLEDSKRQRRPSLSNARFIWTRLKDALIRDAGETSTASTTTWHARGRGDRRIWRWPLLWATWWITTLSASTSTGSSTRLSPCSMHPSTTLSKKYAVLPFESWNTMRRTWRTSLWTWNRKHDAPKSSSFGPIVIVKEKILGKKSSKSVRELIRVYAFYVPAFLLFSPGTSIGWSSFNNDVY